MEGARDEKPGASPPRPFRLRFNHEIHETHEKVFNHGIHGTHGKVF